MTEDEFKSGVRADGSAVAHAAAFDYMAEADKTCSVLFHPEHVDRNAFLKNLKSVVELGDVLNLSKKLLFRGKTPEDLGLRRPKVYETLAVEFDPMNTSAEIVNVVHGIVGMITEAGELAEVLIALIETGEIDAVNVLEECGDVNWYNVRCLRGINATSDLRDKANIDKLHGRHGDTFDAFRDANRDLGKERARLDKAMPGLALDDAKAEPSNVGNRNFFREMPPGLES